MGSTIQALFTSQFEKQMYKQNVLVSNPNRRRKREKVFFGIHSLLYFYRSNLIGVDGFPNTSYAINYSR